MIVRPSSLSGLVLIEPQFFSDSRGSFYESWNDRRFRAAGIEATFVQDNRSVSAQGVLRGFHFQKKHPQGQLVWVTEGRIFDVCVDIRPASPTFGQWESFELSGSPVRQVYMPPGFAHGFCVLSNSAAVHYKCTAFYRPDDEGGIVWNDPTLAIPWPVADPIVSPRDQAFPTFAAATRGLTGP